MDDSACLFPRSGIITITRITVEEPPFSRRQKCLPRFVHHGKFLLQSRGEANGWEGRVKLPSPIILEKNWMERLAGFGWALTAFRLCVNYPSMKL